MRKRLLSLLIGACLIFSGCSMEQTPSDEPQNSQPPSSEKDVLTDYLEAPDILSTPTHEYGEETGYIQLDEDLMIHISYPECDLSSLNEAMELWIQDTVSYYNTESEGCSKDGDSAELTTDYHSFLVDERFVSIKIDGLYTKPYIAHPIDIIAVFHANIQTGSLITLNDLLLDGGRDALTNLVIESASLDPEFIDEKLLDLWTLTSDGLEIILERGDYLPMSDGTVTLDFSYEQLDGILSLDITQAEDTIVENEIPVEDTSEENISEEDHKEDEDEIPEKQETFQPSTDIDPDKPMVALTFDDGPSKHTDRLLDIFSEHGGKGTFFVIGNLLDGRSETLKRMSEDGHEIAGHSWNHRQLTKIDSDELHDQIMTTRAKIYDITGVDATLMRPPYGSYNDTVKQVCSELGVSMINWSLDTLDWKYRDADVVYNTIMSEVSDGDIILCHDLHGTTVDAMELVIPALISEGYQLVTVSELLEYGGTEIEAGNVYNQQ